MPTRYGLTANARLELLSEWTTAPPVQKQTFVWEPAHDGQFALTDERISLGAMEFLTGRGFSVGDGAEDNGVPIAKSFEQIDQRTFLIEKIPWKNIEAEFQKLPPPHAGIGTEKRKGELAAMGAAGFGPGRAQAVPVISPATAEGRRDARATLRREFRRGR